MILENSQNENIDPSQYLVVVLVLKIFLQIFVFLLLVKKEGRKLPTR